MTGGPEPVSAGRAARCDVITPYGYGGPLCSADDPERRDALLLAAHRGMDGGPGLVRRGEEETGPHEHGAPACPS